MLNDFERCQEAIIKFPAHERSDTLKEGASCPFKLRPQTRANIRRQKNSYAHVCGVIKTIFPQFTVVKNLLSTSNTEKTFAAVPDEYAHTHFEQFGHQFSH